MTSATGVFLALQPTSAAASKMARACISQISGYVMARRQPRWPSMGLASCSSLARRRTRSKGTPAAFATRPISASVCGMNSCKGGSSRRTVTGRPSIMRNNSTMSALCIAKSLSRAACRSVLSDAKIICRIATIRPPSKNMCSVRTKPMPSQPNSFAWRASAGVSALARTCMVRNSSAQDMTVPKAPESCGGTVGTSPSITSPVTPSMVTS
mmetsp:Transcript_21844/g.51919  ORF Transcript_21844/g.51919 Transcript_21844/m.51919 type:complete len:211 (+) Transcript_21844:870-1502(+)